MSDHEDVYIDYLGQRDGALFGGEFGRAFREDPMLFGFEPVSRLYPGNAMTVKTPIRRRNRIMAKKAATKTDVKAEKKSKPTKKEAAAARKAAKKEARRFKKAQKLQSRIDKLQTKLDKLNAK